MSPKAPYAIRADLLGKCYQLGDREPASAMFLNALGRLGSALRGRRLAHDDERRIWALRDVSFEIPEGKAVGIVGPNGAGKSTLLKILSRVTVPTMGEAWIRGRVSSLLEVGTGFHHEFTGRENVYMTGALLGMSRSEIGRKMDEIVAFAEVEKFLDTPVKHYSSGMRVRLGFSVAMHLEPEVLIVDEVLSVGDWAFQQKCSRKLRELIGEGRSALVVSHSTEALERLCSRALLIEEGRLLSDGPSHEVVSLYLQRRMEQEPAGLRDSEGRAERTRFHEGEPKFALHEVSVHDGTGKSRQVFRSDEAITLSVVYECFEPVENFRVLASLREADSDLPVLATESLDLGEPELLFRREKGCYRSSVTFAPNTFGAREFSAGFALSSVRVENLVVKDACRFRIEFRGYNSVQFSQWACLRPVYEWRTEVAARSSE